MNIPAKYRKLIYIVVFVGLVGILAFGWLTPDQLNSAADNVVKIVAALTALLAAVNVQPD